MTVPAGGRALRRGPAILAIAALAFAGSSTAAGAAPTRQASRVGDPPAPPATMRAASRLGRELGAQGVVSLDPQTGTPRHVAKLNGFLTPPSAARPRDVLIAYLRDHPRLFRLDGDDLSRLRLVRRYVSRGRVIHISFAQTSRGIPALDQAVTANVTRGGRLINVLGSPRPDLTVASGRPQLSAAAALRAALRDVGRTPGHIGGRLRAGPRRETRFGRGQRAKLVLATVGDRVRLAWRVYLRPARDEVYDTVVDARDGRVLRRQSLVKRATASVFDNYPGAPAGGTQHTVTITPYLSVSNSLDGPYAFVLSDVNDDDVIQASELVPPSSGTNYQYPYTAFPSVSGGNCPPAPYNCSWNHNTANSWQTNRKQSATQLFYFLNHYHDHLAASPIEFTPAKGNFEDEDAMVGENDDGAALAGGLPDAEHVDNAFYSQAPDGFSGDITAYLFRPKSGEALSTVNSSDDASMVYHEYTHGLSTRLITDSDGLGAINSAQSNAMGEAWSDWYAMDFLNQQGFQADTATNGEVKQGRYVDGGQNIIRTQGLDCAVGAVASACPGAGTAGSGGYTYGDFGKILADSIPEPHADGEIWSETLWDLRRRMIADHGTASGIQTTQLLVTAAMELSGEEPSFLDMRDAILQADTVYLAGANRTAIWSVFANRGMGYFASTIDSTDAHPIPSTALPPAAGTPTGTVTGTVRFPWGDPLSGALVYFGGHMAGFDTDLSATTGADGRYTIAGVPPGTYPQLIARSPGPGLDPAVATNVTVPSGGSVARDLKLRRNWTALGIGATLTGFVGARYEGCDPELALDGDFGTSWLTDSPASASAPGPKSITVQLPTAVDLSTIEIDPTANCSRRFTAALGQYRVDVSTDGSTYRTAASGTFTKADLYRRNAITPTAGTGDNVRYVRLVGISSLRSNPGDGGALYIEVTELQAYGRVHSSSRPDFNGDGYADVAIGAPTEDLGSAADAGAVNVMYGGASGIDATGNRELSQTNAGGASEAGDRFGEAVTTGDFNDDGYSDLAASAPSEDVGAAADAGAVDVVYGSPTGLNESGNAEFTQAGAAGANATGDRFGAGLAAGNFNNASGDDLAIGAPGDNPGGLADAGVVNVMYGGADGIDATGNAQFTQTNLGGSTETGDHFGAALAAGDFNKASGDDVAIGVPDEDSGTTADVGVVNIAYGGGAGIDATGNAQFTQANSAGAVKASDRFGAAVAAGDFNGDGAADVAGGAPGEEVGTATDAGAINVLYGGASGVDATGNAQFSQTNIGGTAEADDHFGASLAAGGLDTAAGEDLAVGAPDEDSATIANIGVVNIAYGGASGIDATGNAQFTQANAAGTAEVGDRFGAALTISNFNGGSGEDLGIGAPDEKAGSIVGAGTINLMYGSATGIDATGNAQFTQSSAGGTTETGDRFGAALR